LTFNVNIEVIVFQQKSEKIQLAAKRKSSRKSV